MTDRDDVAKLRPTHSTARGIADELIPSARRAVGPRAAPRACSDSLAAAGPLAARPRFISMTLDQLRIFIVVAEYEHVTRASYALDMVQSAVSKAIATLEGEIAFRLFDRVGRNIRLTETGATFRDRAVALLEHADRFSGWASEQERARRDGLRPAVPLQLSTRPCAAPARRTDLPTRTIGSNWVG